MFLPQVGDVQETAEHWVFGINHGSWLTSWTCWESFAAATSKLCTTIRRYPKRHMRLMDNALLGHLLLSSKSPEPFNIIHTCIYIYILYTMLTFVYNLQIHRYIATEHNDVFVFVLGLHRVFLVLVHSPLCDFPFPCHVRTHSGWPPLTVDFPF